MLRRAITSRLITARHGLNRNKPYPDVPVIEPSNSIPKVIHQTYFTRDPPPELRSITARLRALNPDWSYHFYDDHDVEGFIRENFPKLYPLYDRINPVYGAARVDFFRYLLIYRYGGVYLDIKSTSSAPLCESIRPGDTFVTSYWRTAGSSGADGRVRHPGIANAEGELQQWHIIAAAGHPILRCVIENVCNNIVHYNPLLHGVGSWGVWNLTGPIAYTNAITANLGRFKVRIEDCNEKLNLIYNACDAAGGAASLFTAHRRYARGAHYSQRTESLIRLDPLREALFRATKRLRAFVKSRTIDRAEFGGGNAERRR